MREATNGKEDGNTTTDLESVMRRLKKLLALAMDPAAAPGEAENAMRMAQNLMRKHNVTNAAMAQSEVGKVMIQSSKATSPPVYEVQLLWELMRAFGAKFYWSEGRGPKGARDKGHFYIVAEKSSCELIKYAFEVVSRQMMKARATYTATAPSHWTRPRKATDADAFCLSFVYALAKKITDFSGQDPLITAAIAAQVEDATGGRKAKAAPEVKWSARAIEEGREAGAKASLYRSMGTGPAATKIGA